MVDYDRKTSTKGMGVMIMKVTDYRWTLPELTVVVEAWKSVADALDVKIEEDDLLALVLSGGENVTEAGGWTRMHAVELELMSAGDYWGSDLDVANVRALKGTPLVYTESDTSSARAWMVVGELYDGDPEATVKALEDVLDTLNSLKGYPLLDEEEHSNYIVDLADEAWDAWLGSDTRDEIQVKLALRLALDVRFYAEVSSRLGEEPPSDLADLLLDERESDIRDAYYEYEGNEWNAEGATSVVNGYHNEAVEYVMSQVWP